MNNRYVVKKPKKIGPILRNLDEKSVSILLYGYGKKKKYTYGVVYIIEKDETIVKLLSKEEYYCQRFDFGDLKENTTYTYLCGIFHTKEPFNDDESLIYRKSFYNYFKTTDRNSQHYTFIFGSCRFFLNFFGYGITDGMSDLPFKTIHKLLKKGYPIESMYMIGDSVYMDIVKWIPFIRLKSKSSINRMHITARSTKGFKKVASKIEFKEIPDDHEYKDNGNEHDFMRNSQSFQNAIDAINIFEISSAPHPSGSNVKYWDFFERNNIPIFMSDTRYERRIDENNVKRIYSNEQIEMLKEKMLEYKNSGLPFLWFSQIPFILQNGEDDNFSGYSTDQNIIIDFIVNNQIKNVFILTGDAHACVSSKFKIHKNGNDTGIFITEIMSSGIYQLSHDGPSTFKNSLNLGEYYLESEDALNVLRDNVISKDAFCMIDVNKEEKKIIVTYFKSKGKIIRKVNYDF